MMKLFGIIGFPVEHSISPIIHNQWFKRENINARYQYISVQNAEDIQSVIEFLPKIGYFGCNVTLPYKESAFDIISDIGEVSSLVQTIKAVNCISYKNGRIYGDNTDVFGFKEIYSPKEHDKVLIVGSGGAARAAIFACLDADVTIANRTISKAQKLAEEFQCNVSNENLEKIDLSKFNTIVNTTSAGLYEELLPLNYISLAKNTILVDVIYKDTSFLKMGQKIGCKCINGLAMFEAQAKKSFEIWTGIYP